MTEEDYRRALDAAAKQLSYRALSISQLRDKLLEKGHEEQAADYAIAWLTERGMLNDRIFAESLVRTYTARGCGKMRIRQELTRRGVDRETADEVLEDFSADSGKLVSLLDKRLKGDLSDRKEIDKAVAFLQRRGFSWQEIRAALTEYEEQQSE